VSDACALLVLCACDTYDAGGAEDDEYVTSGHRVASEREWSMAAAVDDADDDVSSSADDTGMLEDTPAAATSVGANDASRASKQSLNAAEQRVMRFVRSAPHTHTLPLETTIINLAHCHRKARCDAVW
jgi:hypothetical protein